MNFEDEVFEDEAGELDDVLDYNYFSRTDSDLDEDEEVRKESDNYFRNISDL